MSTIAAAASASTAQDAAQSSVSRSKLAQNFDTFLVMLTTQLKHQDPLSPMDSTEFTNQLVQFANVEQQINANSNIEKLIGVNQMNQQAMAISYIGRTVEADSTLVPLQGGGESQTDKVQLLGGKSYFSYSLAEKAASVQVKIKDADGNVVRTLDGKTAQGKNEIVWDGKDKDNVQCVDGTYTVEVAAVNSAGTAINATTSAYTRSGKAGFSYTLAEDAKTMQVVIKDMSGAIVRNLTGPGDKGRHEMQWDGLDKDGRPCEDGAYALEVVAVAGDGETVEAATTVYGRITDV
ncbi:MAG TPA: FlgD immunoglobulin-like domain containing protein, partial [Candidatus Omnitrophota bacterium]|nr:FlgD immunoglobulin-like domain containing protein [Candidatus Omnitrophota bacterium]